MCRAHLNSNAEAAPCVRNSGALGFSNMLSVAARVQSHSAVQQHGAARAHVRTHGRYTNEKRNKQKIYVVHKTCFSRRNRTLRSPPEFCCCVRTARSNARMHFNAQAQNTVEHEVVVARLPGQSRAHTKH